jgi:RNA polymerase sigma-70 factor (ECF subfamily)
MDVTRAAEPVFSDPEPKRRFALMVTQHHGKVWRSLRRLGVPESDTDDATQQVFMVAHRRLADIPPESELSFLLQTALRVAADYRRSRRRRREDETGEIPVLADTAANPEEVAERLRARALLDRVLEAMPEDMRCVFVLFELDELSTPEVAKVLHIPRGTVASRLRRAREIFREIVSRLSAPQGGRPSAGGKP